MKIIRIGLVLAIIGLLGGFAYVAQQSESQGDKMTVAAQKFIASLSKEQKAKALLKFDSKERTNWHFIPMQNRVTREPTRKGLPLSEMTTPQQKLALELLATGTSKSGKAKAKTIMALESMLYWLEKGKGSIRDPEWYFVAIFGTPSKTGKWGWRLEGHHLSLNYTIEGGKVISSTPAFFGANPAVVKSVTGVSIETLPDAENMARHLFLSLDAGQKKTAHKEKHFKEPLQGSAFAKVGKPQGLPASKMNEKQRKVLLRLIHSYAKRMPADIARDELKRVKEGGIDNIHFAWTGSGKISQPHTYRIQGPAFVIEFLNTQPDPAGNGANHIHSVWRRIEGDFGVKN